MNIPDFFRNEFQHFAIHAKKFNELWKLPQHLNAAQKAERKAERNEEFKLVALSVFRQLAVVGIVCSGLMCISPSHCGLNLVRIAVLRDLYIMAKNYTQFHAPDTVASGLKNVKDVAIEGVAKPVFTGVVEFGKNLFRKPEEQVDVAEKISDEAHDRYLGMHVSRYGEGTLFTGYILTSIFLSLNDIKDSLKKLQLQQPEQPVA